jgi:hypothetical protein
MEDRTGKDDEGRDGDLAEAYYRQSVIGFWTWLCGVGCR